MNDGYVPLVQRRCFRGRSYASCFLMLLLLTAGVASYPDTASASTMGPALFERLEKFHGHTCAGSLMGARLGLAAKAALKAAGGEGKLKARYYNLSCPVDGVQIAAGTTFGNCAIEVENKGEQRLTLTAEKNGKQVEARLTKQAEEKGALSRELSKKARKLPAGSSERQRLEAEVEAIVSWFRTATERDIVVIQVVK